MNTISVGISGTTYPCALPPTSADSRQHFPGKRATWFSRPGTNAISERLLRLQVRNTPPVDSREDFTHAGTNQALDLTTTTEWELPEY